MINNLTGLEELRQWVNYIWIYNPTKHGGAGGYDKPPINPHTLRDGQTNRPETWATYEQAAANIGKTALHYDTKHRGPDGRPPQVRAIVKGAGLVLAGGYCGVDLDGVLDPAGNVAPFAAEILRRLDTYTEISPSGTGLHCLLYCEDLLAAGEDFGKQFLLDADARMTDLAGKVYEIEIYFYQAGGRYFTVTGKPLPEYDKPINHSKGQELRRLFEEYSGRAVAYRASKRPAPDTAGHAPGPAADQDHDRRMIESALAAIDPGALDFGEWAAIMTALKVLGYGLDYAGSWSAGNLCGVPNSKDVSATNRQRWPKFAFRNGDSGAAGIVINTAKRFGWAPADAYPEEERAQYGQKIHGEDERREYGRQLHTEAERREYGRSLYTDEERREYGAMMAAERREILYQAIEKSFRLWQAGTPFTPDQWAWLESRAGLRDRERLAEFYAEWGLTAGGPLKDVTSDFLKWLDGRAKR